MVSRVEIVNYCNQFLQIDQFKDYCPNGLQVEGRDTVKKIISGVTACQQLIDKAKEKNADMLLVHHGFFWRGENSVVTGMKKRRLKALLIDDINLLAYHLPLDAHKTLGNNAVLAEKLGITPERFFSSNNIALLGWISEQSGMQFRQKIAMVLQREPLHITADRPVVNVALCTGGAQSYIEQAIEMGADAFISGEVSENTWHIARENNIHYYAAGHHATERYGVQALAEHLVDRYDLDHEFIDIHNPV